jgi:hypothetical protein
MVFGQARVGGSEKSLVTQKPEFKHLPRRPRPDVCLSAWTGLRKLRPNRLPISAMRQDSETFKVWDTSRKIGLRASTRASGLRTRRLSSNQVQLCSTTPSSNSAIFPSSSRLELRVASNLFRSSSAQPSYRAPGCGFFIVK